MGLIGFRIFRGLEALGVLGTLQALQSPKGKGKGFIIQKRTKIQENLSCHHGERIAKECTKRK